MIGDLIPGTPRCRRLVDRPEDVEAWMAGALREEGAQTARSRMGARSALSRMGARSARSRMGGRTALSRTCARRVRGLLREVPLPQPWDLDAWLDALEAHRNRPIDLVQVPWTSGESTGAWRRRADHDIIAVAANTTTAHQDHIVLHEIAHLVCEHRGRCVLSDQQAQALAPSLRPAAWGHLLDRVSAGSEEAEAEIMATLLLTEIRHHDRLIERGPTPVDGAAERLAAVFDG